MSNTYRAVSRDHRSKVAVRIVDAKRTPAVEDASNCELGAACRCFGLTIVVLGRRVPVTCAGDCAS